MPGTIILKAITIPEIVATKPELNEGLNSVASKCRTDSGPLPEGMLISPGKYKVNLDPLLESDTIHSLAQDNLDPDDEEFPSLDSIKDYILEIIIKYLYQYTTDRDFWANPELEPGTQKFTRPYKAAIIARSPIYRYIYECDIEILYELILAANFLQIKSLLVLTNNKIAELMIGKNHLEIRQAFGITSDFTPAEEAQHLEENKWTD